MEYKISPLVAQKDVLSYAQRHNDAPCTLDCSLGHNPYGIAPSVKKAWRALSPRQLYEYPHSADITGAICEYWSEVASVSAEQLALSFGSIDAIYAVNQLFFKPGARVLGICPQFTDYPASARMQGYEYIPMPLNGEKGFAFDEARLIDRIDDTLSLIYLDSPNNPTGLTIPPESLERIAKAAAAHGVCVIVDEAYGEFMPRADSAICLIGKYDNIIVLRTFSKGFGLAGLRAGYIVAGARLSALIRKLRNPYCMATDARILAAAAMRDRAFIEGCMTEFAGTKARVKAALGSNLAMAHTCPTTPLCLLTHADRDVDLAEIFAEYGIKTVSGGDFEGIYANSARLRLPKACDAEPLVRAIMNIG